MASNNVIKIYHPELTEPTTYLTADLAAAGTALTVKNNAAWANHDPILYEGWNVEDAEIKEISAAVVAGTALTSSAVTFGHDTGTPLYKITYDQIRISSAATVAGTKSVVATISINASGPYSEYVVDPTATANYYFVQFYNSMASTPYYSDYSDAIAATGFSAKQVGFIREMAFKNIGEEFGGRWTSDWVYDQIYLGELDVSKRLKRWSWLKSFNTDLGNLAEGQISIALPSDIEDSQTNKSVLNVRIASEPDLDYMDWSEYQDDMSDVQHSTTASAVAVAATTITLTNSEDFDDAGTITVKTTLADVVFSLSGTDDVKGTYTAHGLSTGDKVTVSGCTNSYCNREWVVTNVSANVFTLDDASWAVFTGADVTGDIVPLESTDITYTGNDRVNNTLTGITAVVFSIPANTDVWYNIDYGTPTKFTVDDGYIYFDLPVDNDFEGRNVWLDYYTTVTRVDSDADIVSVNDPSILISWLERAIKKEKANGELPQNDPSNIEYETKVKRLIDNELSGQKLFLIPNIEHLERP